MDTQTPVLDSKSNHTMALPGEEPGEAVAASSTRQGKGPASQDTNPASATMATKPAKPSLVRGWWELTSRRTKLLAGVAVVAIAALGGYGIYASQQSPSFDMTAEPGFTPSGAVRNQVAALEEASPARQTTVPREAPQEAAVLPSSPIPQPEIPAPAPVAALPAPVIPAPVIQPALPVEDPQIAEMRRLAREAAAAPAVAPPRADADKAQMAAMVAALSAITRENLQQQIQTRKQMEQAIAALQEKVSDLEQRLTFAEARTGFQAAVGVAAGDARGTTPRTGPAQAPQQQPSQRAAGPAPSYVIRAASTGMAALTIDNTPPGQPNKVEVFVGDDLPGYGKVIKIEQKGTAWQLVAERGVVGQ